MGKPVTTASDAAAAPEVPPGAPPATKVVAPTEVSAPAAATTPARAKSEKALRLAQALRDNLKRRKAAARPARPSN